MATLERVNIEIENPWGPATPAVQEAFRFWDWWDGDPDSDQSLATSSFTANGETVYGLLPEDLKDRRLAEDITRATRLLTSPYGSGEPYETWLNRVFEDPSIAESPGRSKALLDLLVGRPQRPTEVEAMRSLVKLALN